MVSFQSAATVVDGIPLARTEQVNFEFADVERVEVLRGPQGTLFGKNSTAGLVQIITKAPSKEFEGFVRDSYEQPIDWPGSQMVLQFGGSGPISENVGVRTTGFYKQVKGHLDDVQQHNHPPNFDNYGLRNKIQWAPDLPIKATFTIEYQHTSGTPSPFLFSSGNPGKQSREEEDIVYGPRNLQTKTNGQDLLKVENAAGGLTLEGDVRDVTITSITGYRDFNLNRNQTAPGLTGDRLDVQHAGGHRFFKTFTQELRANGSFTDTVIYTFGGLYFRNKFSDDLLSEARDIPPSVLVQNSAIGIFPDDLAAGTDALAQNQFQKGSGVVSNIGLFAQTTWDIRQNLHLTTGARFIYERQTADAFSNNLTYHQATGAPIQKTTLDPAKRSISDSTVIGSGSLSYNYNDDGNLYGSISTGYRGGAIDIGASDLTKAFANPVKPERAFSIELGNKSQFFDRQLQINLALFRTIFKQFQAQVSDIPNGGTSVAIPNQYKIANAGELETRGIDTDFQLRPLEQLSISGSLLYNHAVFNKFIGPCFIGQQPGERKGVDRNGDGRCDEQDISGGALPNAPKFSGSFSTRYDWHPEGFGRLIYAQIGGRFLSKVNYDAAQHPLSVQKGHSVWDLSTGWESLSGMLEISFAVTNIFDQFFAAGYFPFSLENDRRDMIYFVPRNATRQVGGSVKYSFGLAQ